MATMSMQPRRRKPATYGKAARSWNFTDLDTLDNDELVEPAAPIPRSPEIERPRPAPKPETKATKLKLVKKKVEQKPKDAFDVPSSESSDVDELSPVKHRSPPRFAKKVKAATFKEPEAELAPWEKRKATVTKASSGVNSTRMDDKEANPDVVQVKSVEANGMPAASPPSTARKHLGRPGTTPTGTPSPQVTSAAERLRARRMQAAHSLQTSKTEETTSAPRIQKRAGPDNGKLASPRKRTRSDKQDDNVGDMVMIDAVDSPGCPSRESSTVAEQIVKEDVFDFPASSEDDATSKKPRQVNRKPTQGRNRRGKLTTYSSPRKMESAPARLNEMLPIDTDTTDSTQSPPEVSSRTVTPQRSIDAASSSPKTAFKSGLGMTPKQAQVWNSLLPADTPSVLPIESLTIGSTRRSSKPANAAARMMPKSSSDVGRQKPRLVDRLKASARSSSSEESSDESDDDVDEVSDVEMVDESMEQVSQSQSQITSQNSGPKITYGGVRSYLPEDSFEEGLLMEIPTQTPQRPAALQRRTRGKPSTDSQNSAFDLDDSEDEAASGRLRTIHELRAGGGHQRFMDDIGSLLDDIADHNYSARGRRRTALIEIATKLAEKGAADRFFRQGFEQRLLAECIAAPDDVADFALATSFAIMLAGDPPVHAPQTFKDGGILPWLVRSLGTQTDPLKLARERRNNMSKSAITLLSDFLTILAKNAVLWNEDRPPPITARTIALKTLDLLIGRLRRAGDRSEILTSHDLDSVIFSEAELEDLSNNNLPHDLTISVSILESLSTTTTSLGWPTTVTTLLRSLLSTPAPDNPAPSRQHLTFLTLRLCLNLTNDNPRNTKLFASDPTTMHALLTSIRTGFAHLATTAPLPPQSPTFSSSDIDLTSVTDPEPKPEHSLPLDLLVLAMGIAINLTTSSAPARAHALRPETRPVLDDLVTTFRKNVAATGNASSLASGFSNVAFGYLSVVLANFCLDGKVRRVVAAGLEKGMLSSLVSAVEEFSTLR